MKTKILKTIGLVVLVLGVSSLCFAGDTAGITVKAEIPQKNPAFELSFYQITPNPTDCSGRTDTWPAAPSATRVVDFGTLIWDGTDKIFRAPYYGAVDVTVRDNTGASWTVTHSTTTPIAKGTDNLDENVNAVFYKLVYDSSAGKCFPEEPPIYKVSYKGSNGKTVGRAQVGDCGLRIYYGVSNGIGPTSPNPKGCSRDASGVKPITYDKPYGKYSGTVTLTVSP